MDMTINAVQSGKNVLQILRGDLSLSTAAVTFLKKNPNGITLNGNHVTVRATVYEGDVLSLEYTDHENASAIFPVPLPLEILYEDEDILAVNKPPHMPTHPSHAHQTDTLANGIAYLYETRKKPFVFRAINRLDADTSGVVLLAKNKLAASALSAQMAQKTIRKTYLALLHGQMPPQGEIETYMRLQEGGKMKRVICTATEKGAMYSLTKYICLHTNERYSAVLAQPITGRTHQLRVHFTSLDHPFVGDTLYGVPSSLINRQALHALKLTFYHPLSGKEMTVNAPVPHDIANTYNQVFDEELSF